MPNLPDMSNCEHEPPGSGRTCVTCLVRQQAYEKIQQERAHERLQELARYLAQKPLVSVPQWVAQTAPQAQAEVAKPPAIQRVISRSWTVRGKNGSLQINEIPDRTAIAIAVNGNSVALDRASVEAMLKLFADEIMDRWEADQTIEALGR